MKAVNWLLLSGRSLLLASGVVGLAGDVAGEIIPQDRRITWDAGVAGGIPNRTTIYTNLPTSVTVSDINNAISRCPSNQVVLLSAGSYTLSGQLVMSRSHVTLRGAGPTKTTLRFTNTSPWGLVYFIGGGYQEPPPYIRDWTAGYAKGATTITLSSVASLAVGDLICLDQLSDYNLVNPYGNEGLCDYCAGSRLNGDRGQEQYVTVTGISGNNVSISKPLYLDNWSSSLNPQVFYYGNSVKFSGIEDLKIDNSGASGDYNVNMYNAQNCWVKGIESAIARIAHIKTLHCARIEVRDSYLHETKNYASESYGIAAYNVSDLLAENNIMFTVTTPLQLTACSGSVFAYNYMTNLRYDVSSSWLVGGIIGHGVHTYMNLIEGNVTPSIYFDFIHGSGSHNTIFRNRSAGWETNRTSNTFPIALEATNRYFNIVGNVLGKAGYHNLFEAVNIDGYGGDKAIYLLGYFDTSHSLTRYDLAVSTTILRHGNYDYVTRLTQWNPTILDLNIPNSLYLSGKPIWWDSSPWPPIGPDVPGMVSPLPAQNRFAAIMTGLPKPAPPSNLRVIP